MGYPCIDNARPSPAAVTNSTAALVYTNGVELTCTLATNTLAFAFAAPDEPAPDATPSEYKLELHISSGLGVRGVKWQIAGQTGTLPRDTLDPNSGQILFHDTASALTLADPSGATFTIRFPPESIITLRDNREFNRVILTSVSSRPPDFVTFGP